MAEKHGLQKGQPDFERMRALRALPFQIKDKITDEEAQAILYNDILPDSLLEKLKDYIVPEDE